MTDRDKELGQALARLPIPALPEEFWEDLGLRCEEALREETPGTQTQTVRALVLPWRERAPRKRWLAAVRLARFSRLATVGAITALLVLLASLLPKGFLQPQQAGAAIPVVALKPDCGSDGNAAGKGQRLVVAASWDGTERIRFLQVLKRFQQSTGAGVILADAKPSRNLARDLSARIEGHCPPDVAILPQPGLLQDLARGGHLQPIDDVAGQPVDENYAPIWRQWGSFGGKLYGVWFKAADKSRIWYRPEVFQRAGVDPPQTWDLLMQVAAAIQASGTIPFSVAGGPDAGWTLADWFENVYLATAGPDLYDKLANHQIPWTDPSVKRALTTLAEIFGTHGWLAGGTQAALGKTYENSVGDVFGPTPSAAMVYEGDFVANAISDVTKGMKAKPAVDFFDFPAIGGSRPLIVGGDAAVLFTNNQAGQALIRFLATPQAAQDWARAGGFLSPNKNLNVDLYPDARTREAAQTLTQAGTLHFGLSDLQPPASGATVGQGLWQIFRDFLQNPKAVNATAERLQEATRP